LRIRIYGQSKNVPRDLCRRAIELWGGYLLGPRMDKLVSVNVKFDTKLDTGPLFAYFFCTDDGVPPREFAIRVSTTLSKRRTLVSIAHEMVHVKQHAKGILRDSTMNTAKWYGKLYEHDEKSVDGYWLTPWEIEARGHEEGLYCLLAESEKRRKCLKK